ncbi:MAG: hypothetical protein OEQ13_06765 [Acidobacteriota bacterium]|nr:hypothetical protein [Acidobacteriota bacterium]
MNELLEVALGFLVVWLATVLLHGLWSARRVDRDPAPPIPPEPHGHH